MIQLFTVFLLYVLTGLSAGDVIHLNSGGTVTGAITAETDTSVILDIGFGTTSVEKRDILRIERGTEDSGMFDNSRDRTHGGYRKSTNVPPRLKSIDDTLYVVLQARMHAMQQYERQETIRKDIQDLQHDIDSLSERYIDNNKRIKEMKVIENVYAYNTQIEQLHRMHADITIKQHELIAKQKDIELDKPDISHYLRQIAEFSNMLYTKRKLLGALTADEKRFMQDIEERLRFCERDFETIIIEKPVRMGRHVIVEALINRRFKGKFILDTGASTVCFSQAFADKLGVVLSGVSPVEVLLANGARASAKPIVLQSVTVENATVNNVQAMIVDNPPGPGVDGLLGMSFLGQFVISLDNQTSRLTLQRFAGQ